MRPLDTPQDLNHKVVEDLRYGLSAFLTANALWILFSIPIITAPPALCALFYVTNTICHDKPTNWGTFIEGFRTYFGKSWLMAIMNIVIIGLLALNVTILIQFDIQLRSVLLGFYLVVLTLWLVLQIFAFPILFELEKPQIITAYRASFALYFGNLPITLLITLIILGIAAISIYAWPAWLIINGSLITYFCNIGAVYLLKRSSKPSSPWD